MSDIAERQHTLRGPGGIRIEMDKDEIIPDDPGAGTPAMVYWTTTNSGGEEEELSGTFWCVADTGEMLGDRDCIELPPAQLRWLQQQYGQVNGFLWGDEPEDDEEDEAE